MGREGGSYGLGEAFSGSQTAAGTAMLVGCGGAFEVDWRLEEVDARASRSFAMEERGAVFGMDWCLEDVETRLAMSLATGV